MQLADGKSVTLSPGNYATLLEGNPSQVERAKAAAAHLGAYDPMAQLQKAGVDLTQRATVQAVVEQMDALVSRMEAEAARLQ